VGSGSLCGVLSRGEGTFLNAPSYAPQILKGRHTPGEFSVEVVPSRRKSRYVDLTSTSRLEAVQELCNATPGLGDPPAPEKCLCLLGGVHINGRPYKQGDYVEYTPAWGEDHCLGTINLFYAFGSQNRMVFLEITVPPVSMLHRASSPVTLSLTTRTFPSKVASGLCTSSARPTEPTSCSMASIATRRV